MTKMRRSSAAPSKGAARRARVSYAPLSVCFSLSVAKEGLEPILGAAYLLTDRSYVMLSGDRAKTLAVRLRPKSGGGKKALEALAAAFEAELESQKVRWAITKNNQPVREYLAEQAVLLAQGRAEEAAPAEAPAAEELTDEQRREIEKLIAEVEDEIKTMNAKKAPAVQDPKNIKASWEEKQGKAAQPRSED